MDELVFSSFSRNTTTHKCKTREKSLLHPLLLLLNWKERRKKRTRKWRGKGRERQKETQTVNSSQWRECVSCIFLFLMSRSVSRHHALFPVFLPMCPLPSWHHWQERREKHFKVKVCVSVLFILFTVREKRDISYKVFLLEMRKTVPSKESKSWKLVRERERILLKCEKYCEGVGEVSSWRSVVSLPCISW